jgi:hypothetical protein
MSGKHACQPPLIEVSSIPLEGQAAPLSFGIRSHLKSGANIAACGRGLTGLRAGTHDDSSCLGRVGWERCLWYVFAVVLPSNGSRRRCSLRQSLHPRGLHRIWDMSFTTAIVFREADVMDARELKSPTGWRPCSEDQIELCARGCLRTDDVVMQQAGHVDGLRSPMRCCRRRTSENGDRAAGRRCACLRGSAAWRRGS